jgi:hypothetical protein
MVRHGARTRAPTPVGKTESASIRQAKRNDRAMGRLDQLTQCLLW